ncbi:unnamed protein product [Vicia faba]|uniref:Protein kinase domain-containing protein n=1 Tax=Vicia faba TaxID=3906 RepID=A0AAV0Z7G9_VICFA|nr:unnamed protein product [Vicia faba]
MGVCLSAQIKAETPYNTGLNSKNSASAGNDLSSSNSKVSAASVPQTPRSEAKPGTGIVIAVKRLNLEGFQGHREWLAEVNYLGQFSHPHLVRLIGYCLEDEHRLLAYEFMPRGSLENHLFRRGSYFQPLSWSLRLKVAIGAAKGLAFLHSAENKVIYRDFKTSNVLLDSDYNAKLSDFGLAKDGPTGEKTHVSTRVMGTYGYAAPEYLATGHLTTKSDVYSFGVVLLEMLSVGSKGSIQLTSPSRLPPLLYDAYQPNPGNQKRYRRKSADDVSHAKNNTSKSHNAYPRITLSPLYT